MNRSAACTGNTFGKGDEAVITACAEEYDPHSHSILSIRKMSRIPGAGLTLAFRGSG